jgi:fused signal recognition particle receptor
VFFLAIVLLLVARIFRMVFKRKKSETTLPAHVETAAAEFVENLEADRETVEPQVIPEEPIAAPPKAEEPRPQGILRSIRSGLEKTRKALSEKMDTLFSGGGRLDGDKLEDLEEMLITADVGVETSMKLIETLSGRSSEIEGPDDLKKIIREEIHRIIDLPGKTAVPVSAKPRVIMVVGVNGVGKTTTIGKLASRFMKDGKKVLIVAADTFRAAASEQLTVWAERSGADIVRHKENSDPAAVAFDGMEAAVSREVDIVLIDTAGRLHTKKNLMEELKKIKRTVSSKIPDAPHETLMVLDATTGQNALQQAKLFNEAIGISTIALTKLDGTAKGGIVIGISHSLGIPITHIGVGEQVDDLKDFDAREFADALI